MTSGRGSRRSQWSSLSNSFRWCPWRPSSIETVSAPNPSGCVGMPSFDTRRSSQRDSHNRSTSQGVPRKNPSFCSRKTLTPPKKIRRPRAALGSSVRGGV